jgi:16S rRNA (cytosine1402-N4)-methyltransferase
MIRNEEYHRPVLADEAVELLITRPDGIYVDATAGGGGHTMVIASRLESLGRILAIDRDDEAIAATREKLQGVRPQVDMAQGEFSRLRELAAQAGITAASGVLFDLGVSSHQLDSGERGFSYLVDAPLDLRMSRDAGMTAAEIVNSYSSFEIARILFELGEEKNSRKIASAIVDARRKHEISTTAQLASIITSVTNPKFINKTLSRCFQAFRIVVNDELGQLEAGLTGACDLLEPGGRMVVISYHSLEDRIVKNFLRDSSRDEADPVHRIDTAAKAGTMRMLTRKPITPSPVEAAANSRARSAKMRAGEKR